MPASITVYEFSPVWHGVLYVTVRVGEQRGNMDTLHNLVKSINAVLSMLPTPGCGDVMQSRVLGPAACKQHVEQAVSKHCLKEYKSREC